MRTVLRLIALAIMLAGIVAWQHRFLSEDADIDATYKVTASTGINMEKKFFFYLYHMDLFPLATDAPIKADTREEAQRLLREAPKELRQDEGSTFRSGDRGRTYLYFVDAWWHHDALKPSLKPAHWLAFTSALCALLFAFWTQRRSWEGLLLVVLLGSNPFQLFVTYRQENVFSWPITTMIFLLAIHVPLLSKGLRGRAAKYYPFVAAVVTGLLLAAVRNVRSEPVALIASAIAIYATMSWIRWWKRGWLVAAALLSLWLGGLASTSFMQHKLEQSKQAVEQVGGPAYKGPLIMYHEFWHVVFCGLGDYDKKYGYEWNDFTTIAWVQPKLQAMHPEFKIQKSSNQDRYYDDAKRHPVYIGEIPGYHDIARDKVLGDIKNDPMWYLDILDKRLWRVLTETSSVGVATGHESLYAGGRALGLLWCLALAVSVYTRRWALVKLLLFALPGSAGALLFYSGGGMTYYSSFQIFGVYALALMTIAGVRTLRRRRPRRRSAGAAPAGLVD